MVSSQPPVSALLPLVTPVNVPPSAGTAIGVVHDPGGTVVLVVGFVLLVDVVEVDVDVVVVGPPGGGVSVSWKLPCAPL